MSQGAASAGLPDDAAAGPLQLAGVRVLLVEHDLEISDSFVEVLRDFGADVTAVASAPAALALLDRMRPDVVLFGDLELPGESPYDFMRDLTARACPLPVASISAWRQNEKDRELAAGIRLHLTKPVDTGTLVDAVARLTGRRPNRLFT